MHRAGQPAAQPAGGGDESRDLVPAGQQITRRIGQLRRGPNVPGKQLIWWVVWFARC